MKIKMKGSFASFKRDKDGMFETDCETLAKILINWGDIPKSINDTKAFELKILAEAYLQNLKELRKFLK
jgi:hypothetical protein